MKKLLSSLSAVFAYFATNVAFADSSNTTASFLSAPAIANKTDLSVSYLDQVFGTVGNVLTGTSGQMLGHLFYQLNNGILIVAGMWLAYTVFTICVKSAQEGSFMGANKNVGITFLKIAFGMSLLIPYSETGYSFLQDLTMKVVVEGVGLADEVWDAGLDYIKSGGTVWHNPNSSGTSGGNTVDDKTMYAILGKSNTSSFTSDSTGMGQVIFANLVCMYASRDDSYEKSAGVVKRTTYYDVTQDDANNRFKFGGGSSGTTETSSPDNAACGTMSWNIQSVCDNVSIDENTSDVDSTGSNKANCAAARNAVYNMIENLEPAAYNYYCSTYGNDRADPQVCVGNNASTDNVASDNANYFFNALVDYVNAVMPIAANKQNALGKNDDFVKQAEKEGWLTAGRYYWDLSLTTQAYNNISNIDNYVPAVTSSNLTGLGSSTNPGAYSGSALAKSGDYIGGSASSSSSDDSSTVSTVYSLLNAFNTAQSAGNAGNAYTPSDDGLYWTLQYALGDVFSDMESLISRFQQGTDITSGGIGTDPIAFLSGVGQDCIKLASAIWFGVGISLSVLALSVVACQSVGNITEPLFQATEWVKPLFMGLATMLLGAGAILGYYVPLYPYMLFTFGVVGWIIAVIEAMVAAPLVCFGLTHPEGHDFLGEAKQALMLLLSIFIRPALMVIGMIAGMIVSYVALRILIYTFSGICSDLFLSVPSSGAANGNVLSAAGNLMSNSWSYTDISLSGATKTLLVFPIALIIFTSMVYSIVTQSFSLIYVLPDYIMRWIGGPIDQHRTGPAQLAGQASSALSSGASGFGQGMASSNAEYKRDKERAQDKDQQKKQTSVDGPSGS